MGGDVILGPMSEERYRDIEIYIYRDIYMSFIGGALLSRTAIDSPKNSFGYDRYPCRMCRKVCEKFFEGRGHVTMTS